MNNTDRTPRLAFPDGSTPYSESARALAFPAGLKRGLGQEFPNNDLLTNTHLAVTPYRLPIGKLRGE